MELEHGSHGLHKKCRITLLHASWLIKTNQLASISQLNIILFNIFSIVVSVPNKKINPELNWVVLFNDQHCKVMVKRHGKMLQFPNLKRLLGMAYNLSTVCVIAVSLLPTVKPMLRVNRDYQKVSCYCCAAIPQSWPTWKSATMCCIKHWLKYLYQMYCDQYQVSSICRGNLVSLVSSWFLMLPCR